MRWLQNVGWLLGAQLASLPFQVAVVWLAARGLGPADFGRFQAIVSLVWLVALMVQFGQVSSVIYHVRSGAMELTQGLTWSVLVWCVSSTVACLGLWVCEAWVREELLLGVDEATYRWVLFFVPVLLAMQLLGGLARALDRFRLWAETLTLQQGARAMCLLVALWWSPEDLLAACVALCVAQCAAALYSARVAVWIGGWAWLRAQQSRAALRYGLETYAYVVAAQLHERVDLFLIAAVRADPVEVAVYGVATQIANRVRMLPVSLGGALFPELADRKTGNPVRLTAKVIRATIWAVVGVGVVLCFLVPWVVPVALGDTYEAVVGPFAVLLVGTVFYSVQIVLARHFQAVDRQRWVVVVQWFALGVHLTLNAMWLPTWGALGAAMASACSYAVLASLLLALFVVREGATLRELTPGLADARRLREEVLSRWRA